MEKQTTKKIRVQISTAQYEFSHGKYPRGKGYWFFKIGNMNILARDAGGNSDLKYSEAKKLAINYAQSVGHHFISVGA